MIFIVTLCVAYLIGAIPSGYWFARMCGIRDIRLVGSGNSGATNVGRSLGARAFCLVFVADCSKAFFVLYGAQHVTYEIQYLLLIACMLMFGNVYSIFLYGSGGKGVATFVGVLCALYPWLAIGAFITWAAAYGVTRVVGMASVVAACSIPCYAIARVTWFEFIILTSLAFIVLWRHRDNIRTYYMVPYL